jgi:hypothetical protein
LSLINICCRRAADNVGRLKDRAWHTIALSLPRSPTPAGSGDSLRMRQIRPESLARTPFLRIRHE